MHKSIVSKSKENRGLTTIIIFLSLMVSCAPVKEETAAQNDEEQKGISVSIVEARPEDLTLSFEATGTVQAQNDVTVVSETAGRLIEVNFELGDYVEKDQVLAITDDEMNALAVEQARASVLQAEAAHEQALRNLERYEALYQEQDITKSQLEEIRLAEKTSAAGLAASRAQLKQAQRILRNTRIKAPISGYITNKMINRGQTIAQGSPAAQITDNEILKVRIGVSEEEVDHLKAGQEVEIISTLNEERRTVGTISGIGVKALEPTRTFPVEVRFAGKESGIRPGMIVRVKGAARTLENVVTVHVDDLFSSFGQDNLWLLEEGKAVIRRVQTGRRADEKVIIESGLKPGDKVIVSGAENLEDGMENLIVTEESPD